ncbi:MAG TPA: cupin domain-containing protein [Candidatus Binatia bacterium]|jgi:cupin 2 domain-containing protein
MHRPTVTNLLSRFAVRPESELFEPLVCNDHVLFERIVSWGHATAPGLWFDQPRDEWVVLLAGAARLRFEGYDSCVELEPGDSLLIPAGCRHRVEWTAPDRESVWLALHFRSSGQEPPRN